MSKFITLNQLIDFLEQKTLQDEPEPKKARQIQAAIKELIKKYIKKELIHGSKDAIMPTEEHWMKIPKI